MSSDMCEYAPPHMLRRLGPPPDRQLRTSPVCKSSCSSASYPRLIHAPLFQWLETMAIALHRAKRERQTRILLKPPPKTTSSCRALRRRTGTVSDRRVAWLQGTL